jgi:hypothetical protein
MEPTDLLLTKSIARDGHRVARILLQQTMAALPQVNRSAALIGQSTKRTGKELLNCFNPTNRLLHTKCAVVVERLSKSNPHCWQRCLSGLFRSRKIKIRSSRINRTVANIPVSLFFGQRVTLQFFEYE